jgi:hypothetical protein
MTVIMQALPARFPCWCKAVYSWGGEVGLLSTSAVKFLCGLMINRRSATLASWKVTSSNASTLATDRGGWGDFEETREWWDCSRAISSSSCPKDGRQYQAAARRYPRARTRRTRSRRPKSKRAPSGNHFKHTPRRLVRTQRQQRGS